MKRFLLSILFVALSAGFCPGRAMSADGSPLPEFVQQLRPGEKLRRGRTYVDEFVYIGYNDQWHHNHLFVVRQPGSNRSISLLDRRLDASAPEFHRGDTVRIAWQLRKQRIQGYYYEGPFLHECAMQITKLADGPISLFRAVHPDPMQYFPPSGWDPVDKSELELARDRYTDPSYYGVLEYYLATSLRPEIRALAGDPSARIHYSAWEDDLDGNLYTVFHVWNDTDTESDDLPNVIAAIWFGDQYPRTIFEQDPSTGQLMIFSLYL